MQEYNHLETEAKWRQYWKEHNIYKVEEDPSKPKFYVLDMFPYPSGAGLHVGHPLGYIASDIYARYKRLQGYNVLHPMGFDAFGLPAEQYALQTGIHPAVSTNENMQRYREQLSKLGFSFDWSREVVTCDPKYYKWTQWIFTLLFDHYIAYRKIGYVNWCEALGTVLANDQIKDGVSERGGYPVEKRAMTQWYLRITAYAERLLDDLEGIDWSEALKAMQNNWIGRSEGAAMHFAVKDHDELLEIYTTRPDTIFGATFMVLAPEHPMVEKITTAGQKGDVEQYVRYAKSRSELDRQSEVKTVTGANTGALAYNPFTKQNIPIWIADYVLMDYGTGAIMAVPSDDERDNRFAEKFGIEIIDVVDKSDYPGASLNDKVGRIINSGFITGMEVPDAIQAVIEKAEEMRIGTRQINYKMRDANFSRQRYWGEPFPITFDEEDIAHTLPLEELPLELPPSDDFKPTKHGESPLARLKVWVELPDGRKRETDTMPAVAGSSWYYLRYMDPNNDNAFASQDALNYWQDVDLYIGGAEHAVSHLMYARFWHKFFYDKGMVPTNEPFKKLINQGMIQDSEVGKMSKSKYNVINPDEVVDRYGTDCFRMYEMFLGPLENSKPWDTQGIDGVYKFIKKLWRLFFDENGNLQVVDERPSPEELKILHGTIKKVQDDIERYSFNTCISHFMVAVNELRGHTAKREILEPLLVLLAPFAPHLTEELWHELGHKASIHLSSFPSFDASHMVDDEITYPISINGKKRGEFAFSADATPKEIEEKALDLEIVRKWTDGKTVRKVIVVPKRMVNIVV
ncbi:UNVERIFIED_CONTAM: hypothetical protein GTU68_041390 [Idotea baltica]|nr:hypothetical protein [Idotea baltica]